MSSLGRTWKYTYRVTTKFKFKANNNQEEYEALIAGTILALEMGASRLKAKRESQLVAKSPENTRKMNPN